MDFERWMLEAAAVGLRVGGLLTFCPFLGDRAIPNRIKFGLLVAITALLLPVVPLQFAPQTPFDWLWMVVGELLVGLLIGLSVQMVFEGMQFAGQISGVQLGVSLATLFDPQSEADSPVFSVFYNLMTLLLFLQLNIHHWILRALARSFEYLPVGSAVVPELLSRGLMRVMGALFVLGIQIAASILLATLMIDIVISFVSKASPQLPAMLLGLPVKTMTGYALLIGAMALWPGILERRFAVAIAAADRMLHLLR